MANYDIVDGTVPVVVVSNAGIRGAQGVQGPAGGGGGGGGTQGTQGIQGVTGSQGLIGIQGTTGAQGQSGIQGANGAQGIVGIQGTIGQNGIQGSTGSQGIEGTGAQGTTGSQGVTGSQGATGVQGTTGAGSQGTTGIQGATGIQGVQGGTGSSAPSSSIFSYKITNSTSGDPTSGNVGYNNFSSQISATILRVSDTDSTSPALNIDAILSLLNQGDGIILQKASSPSDYQNWEINGTPTDNGTWYSFPVTLIASSGGGTTGFTNNEAINLVTLVAGVPGADGAQGTTGAQGTAGVQGIQGNTGDKGSIGAQGITGDTGSQGLTGIQGTTGDIGVQGITGSQGTIGAQGATGTQGTVGEKGSTGAQGTDGSQGVQGILGTGVQGIQGTAGSSGSTSLATPSVPGTVYGRVNVQYSCYSIGETSLNSLTSGEDNTAMGAVAMNRTTSGSKNVGLGTWALFYNTVGESNTAVGWQTLLNATNSVYNTAIGRSALASITSNSNENVALGASAGQEHTSGSQNVYIGTAAGQTHGSGSNAIVIGYNAQASSSASNEITLGNTAITRFRIPGLTLDTNSASDGKALGWSSTAGAGGTGGFTWITAGGSVAAATPTVQGINYGLSDAYGNIAAGQYALENIAAPDDSTNTAIGLRAGQGAGVGTYAVATGNVFIGADAANTYGKVFTSGSNNIVIGSNAAVSAAEVSNEMTLGNASITRFRIPGLNLDTNTATAGYTLGWDGTDFTWVAPASAFTDTVTNITSDTARTVDTIAMNSFVSVQYKVTIHQNQNVRSSNVIVQKNDTTVSIVEFGVTTVGSAIPSVAVTAEVSGTDMLLKVTVGDGATNNARVFLGKYDQTSPVVPMQPTNLSVSQLAGNVIVAFTPNDNGGAATTYTVTSSPDSITATGSTSPITVTGLTMGTSYTFTVQGTNAVGAGTVSDASPSITPTNQNYTAYFVDGYNQNSGTQFSKASKMNLTAETFSQLTYSTTLGINAASVSNPTVAGYTAYSGNAVQSLRKFEWPSDTVSILANKMPSPSYSQQMGASSNVGTAGYFFGRWGGGGDDQYRTTYKWTYSSETMSTNANLISDAGPNNQAVFAGTENKNVSAYVTAHNRNYGVDGGVFIMPFTTETWSGLSTQFGVNLGAGMSNNGVAAYWAGGVSGAYNNLIKKTLYSNGTLSSLSGTLTASVRNPTGVANSGIAGYFGGGGDGNNSEIPISAVSKVAFSNDTVSTLANTLSFATSLAGGAIDN